MTTELSTNLKNSIIMSDLSPNEEDILVVDRRLVKAVGNLEAAVLMAYVLRTDTLTNGYKSPGEAFTDPKWFLLRYDDITHDIGLSRKRLRRLMKIVFKTGVIETKRMGCPAKNFYRVNRAAWFQKFC